MKDLTFINSQGMENRFTVMGLPLHLARALAIEIRRWYRSSGPEWTASRLKAMKLRFLKWIGEEALEGAWDGIAGRRTDPRIPKGPFGSLFQPKYAKQLRKVINVFNSYNAMTVNDVTPTQWKKFSESVERSADFSTEDYSCLVSQKPPSLWVGATSLSEVARMMNHETCRRIRFPKPGRIDSIIDYPVSKERNAPASSGRSRPETEWIDSLSMLWLSPLGRKHFVEFPQIQRALGPLLNIVHSYYQEHADTFKSFTDSTPTVFDTGRKPVIDNPAYGSWVGKISFIQEPGVKLRAIANPLRIYQVALSRLSRQMYRCLSTLPWDCTFDQSKADEAIQMHLAEGERVYCFDLSDATNNIPLDNALYLLRALGAEPSDIRLFETLSRAPWLVKGPMDDEWRTMRWSVGQPLGLWPSFAFLALWHGILLRTIELHLNLDWRTFYIIGDDVVIFDKEVAYLYAKMQCHFKVPISASKCSFSNKVATFAGKVYTSFCIASQYKWKHSSDYSFIDIAKALGPASMRRNIFTRRQRRVLKAIAVYPEPYGLGWNPLGLTIQERLRDMPASLWEEAERAIPRRPSMSALAELTVNSQWFETSLLYEDALVREWYLQETRDRPDPLDLLRHPKDAILSSQHIRGDIFGDEEQSVFKHLWSSLVKTGGDPRGKSSLEVYESKLSDLLQDATSNSS